MAVDKTYSEDEHIAILTDRVAKETAELSAQRDQLTATINDLESKLDVETSAKAAAELRAEKAEQDLADFKGAVEAEREAAARKEARLAQMRESANHLGDDFFADEKRIARVVAMAEEDFEGYLADLAVTAKAAPDHKTDVPRETAMKGEPAAVGAGTSAARGFLLRHYITPQEG